jgi:Glycosyl hydrolase family 1
LNEPNLYRMLSWIGLPSSVHELERATLNAASRSAGVERYRVSNVVLPEDFDAMQAGLTAAHQAAKAEIKAKRSDLPVGLSVAIIDDQVAVRAGFIAPALACLHDTITDGIPVLGYVHWSLLDNFEWIFGFDGQLGLLSVDRSTFERTPKPSADVFRRIAPANAVEH